jgi:hypothetical protein
VRKIVTMDQTSEIRGNLDAVEFVRTKSVRGSPSAYQSLEVDAGPKKSPIIVSGHQSLTLGDRCMVYRNFVSGQPVVTIIPFWSVDSLAVKASRPKWILFLAAFLLAASVLTKAATSGFLDKQMLASLPVSWLLDSQRLAWMPSLLLCLGIITGIAYLSTSSAELVVYNQSGKNKVRLSLSPKLKASVEQLIEEIETQMGRV